MGWFRWFRILPWSSGLPYFTRKCKATTSTNHWTTSRFVQFSIFKYFWGGSDFRKPPPLVFCSSNIDFYSLICKYYCSIFHSHTASLLLCIEKRHKRRTEEKEFEVSFLRRTDFCKENLMNFVLKGAWNARIALRESGVGNVVFTHFLFRSGFCWTWTRVYYLFRATVQKSGGQPDKISICKINLLLIKASKASNDYLIEMFVCDYSARLSQKAF